MSQNKLKASKAIDIINSKEILDITSKSPKPFIPLWEIFLGLGIALAFSLAFYFGLFMDLENETIDFRFRQRGELSRNHDIVLISITDECLTELGPWPWPRAVHGRLLETLRKAGAKTVAFDIMLSDPSVQGPHDDEAFRKVIERFGRIVLPQTIRKQTVLDPETFEMKERYVADRPIPQFRGDLSIEGYINLEYKTLNTDGVIRKLLLNQRLGDETSFIFGVAAASDYLGIKPVVKKNGLGVGDRFLPYYECYEPARGKKVKSYMLNYAGGTRLFDEISYAEVLAKKFPEGFFDNRLVIIGTRAMGTSEDVKFCPFGALAGVEIHANLLHNILNRRFLQRITVETNILLLLLAGLSLGYFMWLKHGFFANIICLAVAPLWLLLGVISFNFDLVIEVVPLVLLIPIQWSLTRLIQQFISLREKNYELARKVRELAIISEISQAVNFMGSLDKTLEAILSRAVQVLNASRGSIFLLDTKYEELVETATIYGVDGAEIDPGLRKQFKTGSGIAGEVFNSGEPRLIHNVRKEKGFANKDSAAGNIRSLICVPLIIKESAIGVMNIVNSKDGRFAGEDLQTALTMANQAAVVIEKARLFNLATIDGLTGLIVHRHFQAKMEEEFRRAKRYEKDLSYLMTDIDHFKKFNDTWGHQIGDMVLREVAKIVSSCVRDTDVAARYGGEEFAVILPETDLEGAILFAERLREKVEVAGFEGPEHELKVTISIGVSSLPVHKADTALEMIKLADDALYVAKENGRNRVETPNEPEKTK
ncbi:MAG: diguanylate cyclase [Candidatus Rifleibacteriota bacterium]